MKLSENQIECNFCNNNEQITDNCRKKRKSDAEKNGQIPKNNNQQRVSSLESQTDRSKYQLNTAADYHVSGFKDDLVSYSPFSKSFRGAGGGRITTTGRVNLLLPALDEKLEALHWALHARLYCAFSRLFYAFIK